MERTDVLLLRVQQAARACWNTISIDDWMPAEECKLLATAQKAADMIDRHLEDDFYPNLQGLWPKE